ncbi:MAG: hypothetical protein AB7S38_39135 [Vulcanimicrobiota bacterium]
MLLGFNHVAPAKLAADILDVYRLALGDLRGKINQGDLTVKNLEPLAWMKANLAVLQGASGSELARGLCLNACAYDTEYYYYIPFDRFDPTEDPFRSTREVHRVPRGDWNTDLTRVEWITTPKRVGRMVTIP